MARLLAMRSCAGGFEVPAVGVGCWSFGSNEGEYWGMLRRGRGAVAVAPAVPVHAHVLRSSINL